MEMTTKSKRPVAFVSLIGGLLALTGLLWLAVYGGGSDPRAGSVGNVAAAPSTLSRLTGDAIPAELQAMPNLAITQDPISCTLEITTTDKSPENNHSLNTAVRIANYTDQALVEGNEGETKPAWIDYYRLDNASINYKYTIQAKPDWTNNYNLGIIVYNANETPIITDTNTFDNNYGSVTLVADSAGPYFFKVFQISAQCTGHTYSLILGATAPTSTPSPTPTKTPQPTATSAPVQQPTWMAGFDQYEPNFNFDIATTIASDLDYDMNFIPWGGADVDNDFLKIRVKPGLQLTCQTSDLDPGVDPRIAIYSGPSEAQLITYNDDISLGNFNSRVSYYASYEGWAYILVGQGQRMDTRDTVNSDYTFSCDLAVPGATPVPGTTPGATTAPPPDKAPIPTLAPTWTPTPQTSPIATPTTPPEATEVELTFRLVASPEPVTETPEPNGFRTFRVLVYFDQNLDAQMGAGEGVTGFFVLALTPDGNEELAQGYTDEQGQVSFTVPTVGTVRVLVPLLGYDRLIDATRPEVKVRILPPQLPEMIP
jgi:hypothetical protein